MRPSIVLVSLLAVGCGQALEPRTVRHPQPRVRPAPHIQHVSSYEIAVATIATVFEQDLGLTGFPVSFLFYPHQKAFEGALLESGYDPSLARSTARTMTAVGGHRRVLLNAELLAPLPWPGRVALLAHEKTHSLQYELGGGRRGASDQWVREGFADWVAMRVLDRLQALPQQSYRRQKLDQFRAARGQRRPALREMRTFPEWVALAERHEGAVYAQAFLAVDFLIERHGVPAVLRYFERFARSDDRAGNFVAAFGESLDGFEAAWASRLSERARTNRR